ncbi:hypothetical protein QTO31_17915 [Chloroflexus sp. MS-CIW-1]|uniref:hypothetical protein n=1 Tax=Chloroflexus sp. MS-CIW-1 TaxID=3055768 RepID=UPI00264A3074|nr:hypothetical protein [Chloroflexus sp. MS-CIW-1]MDN5273846.1 hypothetical protein [Chloroflexus sp. MS-CIW-1]
MSRELTPIQRLAVEALQEDERLTAGLNDEQARQWLQWATARAIELTRTVDDESSAEEVALAIRKAVRAALQADGSVSTAERLLAQMVPVSSVVPVLGGTVEQAAATPVSDNPPPTTTTPPYPRRWLAALPLSLLAHLGRRLSRNV